MRKLKLKKLDGSEITIEVPEDILVKDMRKIVELKSGIAENMQRIIYKAKLLRDDQRLNEYIKEDGETLHLIKKAAADEGAPQASSAGGAQSSNAGPSGNSGAGAQPNPGAAPFNLNSMLSGILGPQGAGSGADANISI